jgi:peptide/nickel transport system substrate-binding protein
MARVRVVAAIACGVALTLAATACGSSSTASSGHTAAGTKSGGTVVSGGTLTQLIPSDPGNLDPLTTVTSLTRALDFYAYDPLINLAPDGQLVSGLATNWKESGNTYSFTLRKGVTCSDGSAMSPATVAANINFVSNPANKSPLIGLFVPPDAKATADSATSSVTVTLAQPFPFFLESMTGFGLVCGKGLSDPSTLADGTDGSGPYALTSSVAGQQYSFTIRKGYTWGPGGATTATPGMPAKIVVKVVADATTEANELLESDANLATVQGLASKPLSDAGLFHQSAVAPLGELFFNQATGHATANEAVRKAVVSALDLPEIGSVLSQDQGTPSTGLVTVSPKACPGDTVTGTLPAQSATTAASLLGQAGYSPSKPLKLKLIYANDIGGDPGSAFQLASQQLQKIGVDLSLVGDTTTQLESVIFGSGNWDIVNIPLGITTPNEATPFVSGPAAPKGENFSTINNQAYTALATKASALPGTSGCTDWDNAEKQLFKALDVVPFENGAVPTWAKGATYAMDAGLIQPTSLRLVKG